MVTVTETTFTEAKNKTFALLNALPSLPQPVLDPHPLQVLYPVNTFNYTKKESPVLCISQPGSETFMFADCSDHERKKQYSKQDDKFYHNTVYSWGDIIVSKYPTLFFQTEKEADDYVLIENTMYILERFLLTKPKCEIFPDCF